MHMNRLAGYREGQPMGIVAARRREAARLAALFWAPVRA